MSACQSAAPRPAPPDDPVQRLAAYDQLAVSACDFLARFHSKINGYRLPAEEGENPEDADIDPAQYRAYDECRADYGEMAMDLVDPRWRPSTSTPKDSTPPETEHPRLS